MTLEKSLVNKLRFAQIGVAAIHAPKYRDSLVYLSDDIEIGSRIGVGAGPLHDQA